MKHANRIRIGVGLVVVLAAVGTLVLATAVIGKPKTTVVHDPHGDGGGNGTSNPPYCDVVKATSKLVKKGRVQHTVTAAGALTLSLNAPPVLILKHHTHNAIGLPDFVVSPSEDGVKARLTNHRRTVVYTVKRSAIADAIGHRKKYFWVVDQCFSPADRAPDRGSPSQLLEKPRHHHH